MRPGAARAGMAVMGVMVVLGAAACDDSLPDPQVIADLRPLSLQAEPAEGPVGAQVRLEALVVHPDPELVFDLAWIACRLRATDDVTQLGCLDAVDDPTALPPCAAAPESPLCAIGTGNQLDYTLPASAREGRDADEDGQVLVTMVAANAAEGGVGACLLGAEGGVLPQSCRLSLKRLNVTPAGAVANRNPEITSLVVDGITATVALADGAAEPTDDGPEELFLSWFVTAGTLEDFRTDPLLDGLTNEWTPPEATGRLIVVVRDGRGGESWRIVSRP